MPKQQRKILPGSSLPFRQRSLQIEMHSTKFGGWSRRSGTVLDRTLIVDLTDGRTISVSLAWYPRLVHGSLQERNNWQLIGRGEGIHWPDLDEDLSVEGIVYGRPSGESQRSFARWLEACEGAVKQPAYQGAEKKPKYGK